ncbi:PREDICTED: F-box protein At4g00755 [Tarenaya hassleriana]|uniref:F-box protein At4g00755 n=1 Tax=Tarenaya hassleriana TaxID=28532 RepID=UPI00053C9C7B|nr:PREDICTED: F-box protein At4g00755 [Tarenaya hassleriana]XP_010540273.1 PREDICTED: F-box protein At4g00755 [Tarenaya hassleriana]
MDFLNCLETDMSIKILSCLDDPSDLVRVTAVSRSWQELVVKCGLCKQLCLRTFPQLSRLDHVIHPSDSNEESSEAESSNLMEWRSLERDHKVYAFLARARLPSPVKSCISEAVVASSTDNFPAESIFNTLEPRDRLGATPSYWSSQGQEKSSVPETLLYKLMGDVCVVTEINIQPFRAYFQRGSPIYSANYVRFRMGHYKPSSDNWKTEPAHSAIESNYVWTYISQEFPMAQESRLQNFKFPEPVLCIGGYLLVELLGRVQRQEMDGLYYICVSHVKVMGRSLGGVFGAEIMDQTGKFALKVLSYKEPQATEEEEGLSAEAGETPNSRPPRRNLQQLLNFLHRHPLDVDEYVWAESDDDDDDDEEEGGGAF